MPSYCDAFLSDPSRNPLTGRRIRSDGPTARRLRRTCSLAKKKKNRNPVAKKKKNRDPVAKKKKNRESNKIGCFPRLRGRKIGSGAEGDVFLLPQSTTCVVKVELISEALLRKVVLQPKRMYASQNPFRELIVNAFVKQLKNPHLIASQKSYLCRCSLRGAKLHFCSAQQMHRVDGDVLTLWEDGLFSKQALVMQMLFEILFAMMALEHSLALYHLDNAYRNIFYKKGRYPTRIYELPNNVSFRLPPTRFRFFLGDWGFAFSRLLFEDDGKGNASAHESVLARQRVIEILAKEIKTSHPHMRNIATFLKQHAKESFAFILTHLFAGIYPHRGRTSARITMRGDLSRNANVTLAREVARFRREAQKLKH